MYAKVDASNYFAFAVFALMWLVEFKQAAAVWGGLAVRILDKSWRQGWGFLVIHLCHYEDRMKSILLTFAFFMIAATNAFGIVRRHDVLDSQYRSPSAVSTSSVWIDNGCTGTLIAPNWVLTAAHCVDDLPIGADAFYRVGNGSDVTSGLLNVGITKIVVLPDWLTSGKDTSDGVDLALIELDSPITSVTPRARSSQTLAELKGEGVNVHGYGETGIGNGPDSGRNTYDGFKRGSTNVIDELGGALGYNNRLLLIDFDGPSASDPSRFGTGTATPTEGGLDNGDSGGPWIVAGQLAGVSSFTQDEDDVVYGTYSGATAVQPHRAWINSTMGGVNWNTRGTSGFRTAANWGDGVVPLATEAVRFSVPYISGESTPVISIGTGGQAVGRMTVEFGRHELDLNGQDFGFKVNGQAIIQENGTLVVREGRLTTTGTLDISTGGRLELPTGAERSLAISTTSTSDGLFIGRDGTGTLNQNARIDVIGRTFAGYGIGSTGTYNQNAGAIFTDGDVFFGREGTGIWNNLETARASITGDLVFGNNAQGYGVYDKRGGGLTSVTGTMVVGWGGEGEVTTSAGTISANALILANQPGSIGRFEMQSDAIVAVQTAISIGTSGQGQAMPTGVFVQNGGEVDASEIAIGRALGANGHYQLNEGKVDVLKLEVGENGSGSFTQSGGRINVSVLANDNEGMTIAVSPGSVGTYTLADGILNASNSFITSGAGDANFHFTGGTLHVGTFNGDLVNGDPVNGGGSLAPEDESSIGGLTTITGDYTQAAGSLDIEIGEVFDTTIRGVTYDAVDVGGLATLGGLLRTSLLDGFVPNPTDTFAILSASQGISGVFANALPGARLPMVDGRGSFVVSYAAGQVVLSSFLPGSGITSDFNGDGVVDVVDLAVWQNNFGTMESDRDLRGDGDADVDGDGDGADFLAWQRDFSGGPTAALEFAATVPEPAAGVIIAIGLASAVVGRQRRLRR